MARVVYAVPIPPLLTGPAISVVTIHILSDAPRGVDESPSSSHPATASVMLGNESGTFLSMIVEQSSPAYSPSQMQIPFTHLPLPEQSFRHGGVALPPSASGSPAAPLAQAARNTTSRVQDSILRRAVRELPGLAGRRCSAMGASRLRSLRVGPAPVHGRRSAALAPSDLGDRDSGSDFDSGSSFFSFRES